MKIGWDLGKIYLRFTWYLRYLPGISLIFTLALLEIASYMTESYLRFDWDFAEIFLKFEWNLGEISQSFVKDLSDVCYSLMRWNGPRWREMVKIVEFEKTWLTDWLRIWLLERLSPIKIVKTRLKIESWHFAYKPYFDTMKCPIFPLCDSEGELMEPQPSKLPKALKWMFRSSRSVYWLYEII